MYVADVTGDGLLDLITNGNEGTAVFPGVGDGTFDDRFAYGINFTLAADFDNDDDPDILGSSFGSNMVYLPHNAGIQALSLRAGQTAGQQNSQPLQTQQLQPIIDAAKERWKAAGLPAEELARMDDVSIRIADLNGDLLGYTIAQPTDSVIWIDSTAAGIGWFIDATPGSDEEFSPSDGLAPSDSLAARGIDLLTTVLHEMGHLLGLHDPQETHPAGTVMDAVLTPGARRLPTAETVDAIMRRVD